MDGGRPARGDDAYRLHLARHRPLSNRWGSFAGDQLVVVAALAFAVGRRQAALRLLGAGLGIMVLGHVIAGNLAEELRTLAREPVGSTVHEARFLASLWRAGPPTFRGLAEEPDAV